MWLALVVGTLFLAGSVYNVFGPEPNVTEAIGGATIGAILFGVFFGTRYHENRADEFDTWLSRNAPAIARGGAMYGDALVSPTTVLTRYQVALSFLIVTLKIPTRFYIVDHDRTRAVAAACTLVSLLLGWWGIPWGPVYTVQVVTRNLRGGIRQTVADNLAITPAAVR
jgi:hypothetical protein